MVAVMSNKPASGVEATGPGPIDMESISQNIQMLPEVTLDQITRGPLVQFLSTCNDVK